MTKAQLNLIKKARKKFGKIKPLGRYKRFTKRHFTIINGELFFCFNDPDGSTDMIK